MSIETIPPDHTNGAAASSDEQEARRSRALRRLVEYGAAFSVMVYIAGFLVVGQYQASRGFSAPTVTTPRVAAAGIAFVFLACVSGALTLHILHIKRIPLLRVFEVDQLHLPAPVLVVTRGAFLFPTWFVLSAALPLVSGISFKSDVGWWPGALMGAGFIGTIATNLSTQFGAKKPYLRIGLYWVFAFITGYGAWLDRGSARVQVIFWLWITGLFTAWTASMVSDRTRDAQAWLQMGVMALAVITFYARFVYPVIPPALGGGQPQHVSLYLSQSNASQPTRYLLLEHVSEGVFVSDEKDPKSPAVFIPFGTIERLSFQKP